MSGIEGGLWGLESEVCMIGRVSEWFRRWVVWVESEVCMIGRVSEWVRWWVVWLRE